MLLCSLRYGLSYEKKNSLWVRRSISEWLHGEFAQRAKHQKGVLLQDVRESSSVVGALQGLSILRQMKKVNPIPYNTSVLKKEICDRAPEWYPQQSYKQGKHAPYKLISFHATQQSLHFTTYYFSIIFT